MRLPAQGFRRLQDRPVVEGVGVIVVLAAAVALYRGGLAGFFVQDDFGWLESTRFRSFGEYAASFFKFNTARTYRPLSQETFFWLGQQVFGMWPAGFHAVSLATHLAGSVLVYVLLRMFVPPLAACAATLFYAVHAAHLWSIYWISALPEPLALVFYLAAVILFVRFDRTGDRRAYAASLGAMLLGMASKESILSVPLVLAAYSALYARRRLWATAPFFALSAAYTVLRLASRTVAAAPYALSFGAVTWHNFLQYLVWSAGLTDSLVVYKLKWPLDWARPVAAAAVGATLLAVLASARDRRAALFGAAWFLAALQPVLYFTQHVYAYYLAPALAGVALLLALGLERVRARWPRLVALPIVLLASLSLWTALANVRREGRWWRERSFQAREFVRQMRAVDLVVPDDHTVYIAGLEPEELGTLQEDAVLKAYGFSTGKYILFRLDPETPRQIRHLRAMGELRGFHLYVAHGWKMEDWSEEFRKDPEPFLALADGYIERPDVRVEVEPGVARAGRDTVKLRVHNLDAESIDVFYTIDGEFRPPFRGWRLGPDGTSEVALGAETPRGHYYYLAIRDSAAPGPDSWIRTYCKIEVR